MSCKSIFVNLGGGGGGSVNTGVLQIAGGVALDSTLRFVEDQNGTDSKLQLSTSQISFAGFAGATTGNILWTANSILTEYTGWHQSDGTYRIITKNNSPLFINIESGLNFANGLSTQGGFNSSGLYVGTGATQNGALTVKGSGGNIASFRNSSNVERAVLTNDGDLTISNLFTCAFGLISSGSNGLKIGSGLRIKNPEDGVMLLQNDNANSFNRLQLGGTTASFSSIKRSGINIEVRLADDTGYGGITAGRSTEKTLEVLEVSGAMGLGFFNTPAINQPTTAIGEATYVSSGGGGSQIRTDDTIGGYTMQQIVQALLDLGLLG
jgi:hypothetical protein